MAPNLFIKKPPRLLVLYSTEIKENEKVSVFPV